MDTSGLLWQDIMNGAAVGNTTAASATDEGTAKTKSQMNETKEMFLKLLVAEMQYQDPLQPTDNSEYVKELSQFTQVETLNSVNDQVEQLSAHSLVGKYVELKDSDTGKVVEGKVDFVSNNNGTMYVSVGGNQYKVSDITSVAESNYFENTTMAENIERMIALLPDPEKLTLSDSDKVSNVAAAAAALSPEAQAMVSEEAKNRLAEIVAKMNELKKRQAEIDEANGKTTPAEDDKTQPGEATGEQGNTEIPVGTEEASGAVTGEAATQPTVDSALSDEEEIPTVIV